LRRIATQVFAEIWLATRTASLPEQHTMPNRTATFVSTIVASLCAGMSLTASIDATPARAADECLAAPKGETPEGSHWYYRIEHPSNRHCWHLREGGDAQAQAAPSNSSAAAKQAPPKQDAAMSGSVANAHAELTAPQAPLDQDAPANTGQIPAAASATNIDSTSPATAPDNNMLRSVVASRWPNQLSASASAAPPPAPVSPPADTQANDVQANDVQANDVQANDVQTSAMQANAVPPPPQSAPAPTVPLAAADASTAKQSGSAMMLLAVIVGALSVAGLAASAIFRFGGKRRRGREEVRGEPRPIWDLDRDFRRGDRPLPFPASVVRPNIGAPLELQEADDAGDRDRIEQMLARLARSAQS
jgi:hypothetical protein